MMGSNRISVKTDIVDADIPLLLSKEALKKSKAIINFNNDTVTMFGEKLQLISTSSGHYAISMTPNRDDNFMKSQLTLLAQTDMQKKDYNKIVEKLHRQFFHCSAQRLKRLVVSSKLWEQEK